MNVAKWWKQALVMVLGLFASEGAQAQSNGQLPAVPADSPQATVHQSNAVKSRPGIHPVIPSGLDQSATTYHYTGSAVKDQDGYYFQHISLQAIYCGDGWGSNYSTVQKLEGYLKYIVNSSYLSELSVYGSNKGTFSSGLTYSASLPKYTNSNHVYVNDSDIQGWLNYWVNKGYIDPNHSFVMYFEPGVAINTSFGTSVAGTGTFLGYHSAFWALNPDNSTYSMCTYLVLPYPGGPNYTSNSQNFKSDFDQLTAVSSHEIAECSTDAWPGYGWIETVYKRNQSNQIVQTLAGEEIGDVPLLLLSYNYQKCYCRLGGYLVQKVIAKNGTSVLTPSGSTAPDTIHSTFVTPVMDVIAEKLGILGIDVSP